MQGTWPRCGVHAFALLLAWTLALSWSTAFATSLVGTVVGVSDGDTVTVLDEQHVRHVIRLAGIDAPEKGMPFGQRSKQHLSDLVFGRHVEIDGDKLDRYRRRVGIVRVNGQDANLAQVHAGLAWHYREYEREQTPQDRQTYREAEVQARQAERRLWVDAQPQAPWDWRRQRKQERR